jgi:hypothetical protein
MSVHFVVRIAGHGLAYDANSVRSTISSLIREDIMPGLLLDISDPRALITLPAQKGFIIGTLFHRYGPPGRVEELEPTEIEAIWRSKGGTSSGGIGADMLQSFDRRTRFPLSATLLALCRATTQAMDAILSWPPRHPCFALSECQAYRSTQRESPERF